MDCLHFLQEAVEGRCQVSPPGILWWESGGDLPGFLHSVQGKTPGPSWPWKQVSQRWEDQIYCPTEKYQSGAGTLNIPDPMISYPLDPLSSTFSHLLLFPFYQPHSLSNKPATSDYFFPLVTVFATSLSKFGISDIVSQVIQTPIYIDSPPCCQPLQDHASQKVSNIVFELFVRNGQTSQNFPITICEIQLSLMAQFLSFCHLLMLLL